MDEFGDELVVLAVEVEELLVRQLLELAAGLQTASQVVYGIGIWRQIRVQISSGVEGVGLLFGGDGVCFWRGEGFFAGVVAVGAVELLLGVFDAVGEVFLSAVVLLALEVF